MTLAAYLDEKKKEFEQIRAVRVPEDVEDERTEASAWDHQPTPEEWLERNRHTLVRLRAVEVRPKTIPVDVLEALTEIWTLAYYTRQTDSAVVKKVDRHERAQRERERVNDIRRRRLANVG